jgi:uncharacterized protein involved in response to NO
MPIPRLRDYSGPALFSYGFRPFFFFGAVTPARSSLVWLPAFYGQLSACRGLYAARLAMFMKCCSVTSRPLLPGFF